MMPNLPRMVLLVCSVASMTMLSARADSFLLRSGARLQGELVNTGRKPDDVYIVRLGSGGQWTLAADRVRAHRAKSDDQLEYEARRQQTPDTAEGHWGLAKWCEDHKLGKDKLFHWNQVLKHDPDHREVRAKLKHVLRKGEWLSLDELRERQGQVLYRGAWQMKTLVDMRIEQERIETEQKRWRTDIRRWREWLSSDRRRAEGLRNIRAVNDPVAVWGLGNLIGRERNKSVRELYIDALGRIDTPLATSALLQSVVEDRDATLRDLAIKKIKSRDVQQTVPWLIGQLRTGNYDRIDRASVALGRLGESSAILPLIGAIVTRKVETIQVSKAGSTSASFGSGGTGFSSGAKSVDHRTERNSPDALAALQTLTGGKNFHYSQSRWMRWYDKQTTPDDIDLRRGI